MYSQLDTGSGLVETLSVSLQQRKQRSSFQFRLAPRLCLMLEQNPEPYMSRLQELAAEVGAMLKARNETIAVSESSSGGLVSAALLAVPGASVYFVGGAVIYTAQARDTFLDVDLNSHTGMRSATEPYALLCAQSAREKLNTTWGLSETGSAGPTGNRYGDPAGHTCVAISGPVELSDTLETSISDRADNMELFSVKALELLAKALNQAT